MAKLIWPRGLESYPQAAVVHERQPLPYRRLTDVWAGLDAINFTFRFFEWLNESIKRLRKQELETLAANGM